MSVQLRRNPQRRRLRFIRTVGSPQSLLRGHFCVNAVYLPVTCRPAVLYHCGAVAYTSRMARVVLLCGFISVLHAQQGGDGLLAELRAKVADSVGRLSSYMCTQTIERRVYALQAAGQSPKSCAGLLDAKGHGRLLSSDRLRLDVGASKSDEMYSWAGENRFYDRRPGEIVGHGATSNGSFTALLAMIFTSDPVRFSYIEEHTEAQRQLVEFAFEAPLERSHYTFTQRFRVITAYEGNFLVDSKTLDLVRLTIRTKELPTESGACEAATTTDYQNVRLHNSILLLPSLVRLVIVNTDGSESVNETGFSGCREFQGESAVNFGDDASKEPSSNSLALAPPELVIRKGLPFELALTQDIDTGKAAAGETVRCELVTPIREGRNLVVPAGTPVTARIVELMRTYGPPSSLSLSLRLESLELAGTVRNLSARTKGVSRRGPRAPVPVHQSGTVENHELTMVFPDPTGKIVIKSGLKTDWITGP
jgi:hypothetical protein